MAVIGPHHSGSAMPHTSSPRAPKDRTPSNKTPHIPAELIAILCTAVGIFLAVWIGSMVSAQAPDHSPWLFMLSFAAPAAVVYAIFWLISRRL